MAWLGRWSNWAREVVLGAAALTGCFRDQPTGLDRICPAGEDTCICLEGQECRTGLTCMEDGRCRDPRCVDGRMDCACIDGNRCDDGLECIDMSCLVPGGEDSTSTSTGVAESTPTTTESSMTSIPGTSNPPMTSGPAESSDTLPITETLPTSGLTEVMTTNISMNETSISSDTMTTTECACGWDGTWYVCGVGLPEEDPGGSFPRACPNGTEDVYNAWSPGVNIACPTGLTLEGCCLDDDTVAWCASGVSGFEECNADHTNCLF